MSLSLGGNPKISLILSKRLEISKTSMSGFNNDESVNELDQIHQILTFPFISFAFSQLMLK